MKRTLSICVVILAIAMAIGFLNHIRPADLQTTDFINPVVRHGGGATLYSRPDAGWLQTYFTFL